MNPLDLFKEKSTQDAILLMAGIGGFLIICEVAFRISKIEKVNLKTGQIEADTDDDEPKRKPAARKPRPRRKV